MLSAMIFPRHVQAVVFDMDGVLFDTETMVRDAMLSVSQRLGLNMPMSLILSLIGLPAAVSRDMVRSHCRDKIEVEDFYRDVGIAFDRLMTGRRFLKTGVVELLDYLDRHRIPRAIATSSQRSHVERNLAVHDLSGRFDAVVADGDCHASKPSPEPFLAAADKLRVSPLHCVAIEDSVNGIRSATAARMMTIMVPDLIEPSDEIRSLCLTVARDLDEVRQLLALAGDDASR
jgi:beta-phosphoglucomutase-like phosphatase (HAD superfamily)